MFDTRQFLPAKNCLVQPPGARLFSVSDTGESVEIEIENNQEKWFLSPESYPIIEHGDIEYYINSFFEEAVESTPNNSQKKPILDSIILNENKIFGIHYLLIILLIAINVTIYLFVFRKKETPKITPEMMEILENEIIIISDSINGNDY